ncbi:MAG: hypothetical protein KA428_08560 [Chitinophagaceae bacterium]|nr:hypothetical protein [Chitinophagaceae bacterium]
MEQGTSLFEMNVSAESRSHLSETAVWARFLGICGMICIVLLIVFGFIISQTVAKQSSQFDEMYRQQGVGLTSRGLGAGMMVMYVIFGLIYFFPCLFIMQFATKMKLALASNDSLLLSESFRSLKKTFRYLGVLTVIGLLFVVLALVTGGVAALSS